MEHNGKKDEITLTSVLEKVKMNYPNEREKVAITAEATGDEENKLPGNIIYNPPASELAKVIVVSIDEKLKVTGEIEEPD